MRLYAAQGRRGAALRQYEECVEVLKRELDVEPEDETRGLYRELLRGHGVAREDRRSAGASRAVEPSAALIAEAESTAREVIPLVGREAELARLRGALDDTWDGRGRAVAITGGKGP